MTDIQPVILCGGNGARLWPLSRKSFPKQFVSLVGRKSLLQATFERVSPLVGDNSFVAIANREHRFLVRDVAASANVRCTTILEPDGRNTAPAMAVAALNSSPDQLLLFLPADHHIPDTELFLDAISAGISEAQRGRFVVFGVEATQPHTGYGYIQIVDSPNSAKPVKCFIEKPEGHIAKQLILSGDCFWNSGIFLVRADELLRSLFEYAPNILECSRVSVEQQTVKGDFIFLGSEAFIKCKSESIDYAVLQKHTDVVMIPFLGRWSDVGSWSAVSELMSLDGSQNGIVGQGRVYGTNRTYIHAPNRPVVALGVDDLIIVDTQDALLVASKDQAEKVRDIVENLVENGVPQASEHRRVARPWGEYDTVDLGDRFKVKRLIVKPGASLSLQLHHHRTEHWVVVKGTARVTCGDKVFTLVENESTYIPAKTKHRLENPGTIALEMVEVQSGNYLEEDDIVRFDDEYGRDDLG